MIKARMSLHIFWLAASLAGSSTACRTWVAGPPTPDRIIAAGEKGSVRVVKTDNSVVTLNHPRIGGDSLFGTSAEAASEHIAIPLAEIRSIETKEVSTGRSAGLGTGVIVGLLAIGGLIIGIALLGSHGQY